MRSSRLNGFVAAAALGLVAATAAPLDAQAGSQSVTQSGDVAPEVLYACYTPLVGALYLIEQPGLQQSCLSIGPLQHTEISWNPQGPFRPPPPPERGSTQFEADLETVRATALSRTPADAAMANFWNLSNGTIAALGYWDERAAEYILARGMDERSASHVFALVNRAAMDALIGCWEANYAYMFL